MLVRLPDACATRLMMSLLWVGLACTVGACRAAPGDATSSDGNVAPPGAGSVAAGTGGTAALAGPGSMADGVSGAAANAGTGGNAGVAGAPQPTGTGGTGGTGGSGGAGGTAAAAHDYAMQAVTLAATLTIAAGETVRIGPGTAFTAKGGVKIDVAGTLIIEGTKGAPAQFMGTGVPMSWDGIVIERGGVLTASHLEVSGAKYGIHALPGSDFNIDYATFSTSFKGAVIESDGTIDHSVFNATNTPGFALTNEVGIDDINGTLTILAASPTVTNSRFIGNNALVDMVRIGGDSSPTFDHVHVIGAHCGFHINGAANNSPTVTNSVLESLSYGFMAYTSKPTIKSNNFVGNGNDIGYCFGATADNAPSLTNNFYMSRGAVFDPSCFQIGTAEPSPAAAANVGAGPVGL